MKKTEKFYSLSPTERTIFMLINELKDMGFDKNYIIEKIYQTHNNAVDRHRQLKLINKIQDESV